MKTNLKTSMIGYTTRLSSGVIVNELNCPQNRDRMLKLPEYVAIQRGNSAERLPANVCDVSIVNEKSLTVKPPLSLLL